MRKKVAEGRTKPYRYAPTVRFVPRRIISALHLSYTPHACDTEYIPTDTMGMTPIRGLQLVRSAGMASKVSQVGTAERTAGERPRSGQSGCGQSLSQADSAGIIRMPDQPMMAFQQPCRRIDPFCVPLEMTHPRHPWAEHSVCL